MNKINSFAFVYKGKPKAVELEKVGFFLDSTDLLVKIRACTRCGSEKTIYSKGHKLADANAPIILGHEIVAEVVEIGAEVKDLKNGIGFRDGDTLNDDYLNFRPGERVTFQPRVARYSNGLMLLSNPIVTLSYQLNGGFSEYMRVPKEIIQSESIIRIPDCVSDEEACLIEPSGCALESIYATPHPVGVDRDGRHIYRGGIKPGGKTCIIGSGTMAIIYAKLAILEGANEIWMLVRSEEKREFIVKELGPHIKVYITPKYDDAPHKDALNIENTIAEDLLSATGGHLFDDVVSACSDPNAQRLMLNLYTKNGYAVGACFGGTHLRVDSVDIDQNHYRCSKTIGTSGCSTKSMKTILTWLAKGIISLKSLTSEKKFTLNDDPHEFFMTNAGGLRPILYPNG